MEFIKHPGARTLMSSEGQDVAVLVAPDPSIVPDTVTLPESIGGYKVSVSGGSMESCPQHDHKVWTLRLDCARFPGLMVAECDQFYWYAMCPSTREH